MLLQLIKIANSNNEISVVETDAVDRVDSGLLCKVDCLEMSSLYHNFCYILTLNSNY